MILTRGASIELAQTIAEHLPGVHVTIDLETVSPQLLAGTPCIFIPPPKLIETTVPTYTLRFEIAVIGAPVADQPAAWEALDKILSLLDSLDLIEDADPVQWDGAQSATAPAYSVSITRIYRQ